MKPRPIEPLHPSMYGARARVPLTMSRMKLARELKESATNIALTIFTESINAGWPFQDAILAVYLSGLENGAEGCRDIASGDTRT